MPASVNNSKRIIWWGLPKLSCLRPKVTSLTTNKKMRYTPRMIDKGLNAGREWSWSTIVRPTNNRMIKRVMTNQVVTRFSWWERRPR